MAKKPDGRSSIYFGNDGYWHGWVTLGIKPDGFLDRRHRMAATEAEVTRKVRELENTRESGQVTKPGRAPTVAEWMTEYLDVICERLVISGKMAPRTLTDYRSKTRHWIIPLLGRHRLNRLAPEHLDTAYTTMLEKNLSTSTVLKAHRKIQAAERLKAGERWEDHDLVFATRHGGPIERTEDWKVWKTILKQAGVRDVRVHDARHTAATPLIEQGVNIRVVQEVLGHTRVTTTERYAHVSTPHHARCRRAPGLGALGKS
ncbi:tyrosine-type recombinase/integrase [Streptosporangium sp. G12]